MLGSALPSGRAEPGMAQRAMPGKVRFTNGKSHFSECVVGTRGGVPGWPPYTKFGSAGGSMVLKGIGFDPSGGGVVLPLRGAF